MFIYLLEHNYTGKPAQFWFFLNLSTTMLTIGFNNGSTFKNLSYICTMYMALHAISVCDNDVQLMT